MLVDVSDTTDPNGGILSRAGKKDGATRKNQEVFELFCLLLIGYYVKRLAIAKDRMARREF
jgi:hypothetical protein